MKTILHMPLTTVVLRRLWMLSALLVLGCGAERRNSPLDGEDQTVPDGQDGDGSSPDLPDGCFIEECNGLDDDCDGEIDEDFDISSDPDHCGYCGFACVTPHGIPSCEAYACRVEACEEGYFDVDGDPYNGCEYECLQETSSESIDTGTCSDGLDNDCDGRIDDDDPDCNDCVPEFCNSEDDDCDTLIDEDFRLRTDPVNCGACGRVCPDRPNAEPLCGLGECYIQCDPGYSDLNEDPMDGCEGDCVPSSDPSEYDCDGVDNDCDGAMDEDYVPYHCGSGACETSSVCLLGTEVCLPLEPESTADVLCDGIDNDCDGMVDEEFAPVTCVGACAASARCEDGIEICGPRIEERDETCDGIDGDCDRSVDEEYESYTCGLGPCMADSTCIAGEEDCSPGTPSAEVCDDEDNDCNGEIDDPFECRAGQTRSCTTSCGTTGQETCSAACEWGACIPPSETCNGVDDDCNSTCDDGYQCCQGVTGSCTTSCGTTGSRTCSASCSWGTCTPPSETCNGTDDDCDGACDESWSCCRGTTGSCTTSCGSTGSRTCSSSCSWGTCTPPSETCNGSDDDCDGICDDGWTCCRGTTGSCTTSCGSTGSRTCSSSCSWGTCTPPSETCNGSDDDCDGSCDEGWTCCRGTTGSCTTSCGTSGTRTCGTSCTWGSCTPPSETCNGVDDDCDGATDEGFGDSYEPNNTCATANDRGTVGDAARGVFTVNGNILNSSDSDWYRVSATDDTDTTDDEWDFQVYFVTNPGGLAMDVYRGSCSSTFRCLGVANCSSWTTDYRSTSGFPYVGEDPCGSSATLNQCENDTSTFYIRIYRVSGSGYCANYSIRIQNNPTTNCSGWASPVAGPDYP